MSLARSEHVLKLRLALKLFQDVYKLSCRVYKVPMRVYVLSASKESVRVYRESVCCPEHDYLSGQARKLQHEC